MTQQETNIKIAEYILEKCKGNDAKNLRFHQLLFNLGINSFSNETIEAINNNWEVQNSWEDKYNEPSITTLNKLNQ